MRAVNVDGTGKWPWRISGHCLPMRGSPGPDVHRERQRGPGQRGAAVGREGRALGRLLASAGNPVGVIVRTAAEIAAVVRPNPFPEAAPIRRRHLPDELRRLTPWFSDRSEGEEMRLGSREIFVHYGAGMADSGSVSRPQRRARPANEHLVRPRRWRPGRSRGRLDSDSPTTSSSRPLFVRLGHAIGLREARHQDPHQLRRRRRPPPSTACSPGGASRSSATGRGGGRQPSPDRQPAPPRRR